MVAHCTRICLLNVSLPSWKYNVCLKGFFKCSNILPPFVSKLCFDITELYTNAVFYSQMCFKSRLIINASQWSSRFIACNRLCVSRVWHWCNIPTGLTIHLQCIQCLYLFKTQRQHQPQMRHMQILFGTQMPIIITFYLKLQWSLMILN